MANFITFPVATGNLAGLLPASDKRVVDSIVPGASITGSPLTTISLTVVADDNTNPAANSIRDFTTQPSLMNLLQVYLSATNAALLKNTPATFVTFKKGSDTVSFAIARVLTAMIPGASATEVALDGRRTGGPGAPAIPDAFNTGTVSATFFQSAALSQALPISADDGDVLTWNNTTELWEAADAPGGGGGGGTDDQDADEVSVDATQFDGTGNLSSSDTDVQTALETIDGLTLGGGGGGGGSGAIIETTYVSLTDTAVGGTNYRDVAFSTSPVHTTLTDGDLFLIDPVNFIVASGRVQRVIIDSIAAVEVHNLFGQVQPLDVDTYPYLIRYDGTNFQVMGDPHRRGPYVPRSVTYSEPSSGGVSTSLYTMEGPSATTDGFTVLWKVPTANLYPVSCKLGSSPTGHLLTGENRVDLRGLKVDQWYWMAWDSGINRWELLAGLVENTDPNTVHVCVQTNSEVTDAGNRRWEFSTPLITSNTQLSGRILTMEFVGGALGSSTISINGLSDITLLGRQGPLRPGSLLNNVSYAVLVDVSGDRAYLVGESFDPGVYWIDPGDVSTDNNSGTRTQYTIIRRSLPTGSGINNPEIGEQYLFIPPNPNMGPAELRIQYISPAVNNVSSGNYHEIWSKDDQAGTNALVNATLYWIVFVPGESIGLTTPEDTDDHWQIFQISTNLSEGSGGGGSGTDDQEANEVPVDATSFAGNLSDTDIDVQTALDTLDALEHQDTHPSISFTGFPDQTDIYDGIAPNGIGFHVYRNGSVMSRITSGTPTATQYLVTHTNLTGVNSTFAYDLLNRRITITGVSLGQTVTNGARESVRFDFTFLGEDDNTFQVRKEMAFRRVDRAGLPPLTVSGENLTINQTGDDVEWAEDDRHITEFQIGREYQRNIIVRYQDVLYRALVAITAASSVPPLNDDWSEISSHGIEGYGEVADDLEVDLVITPALLQDAISAVNTRTQAIVFLENNSLPQAILSPNGSGRYTAQVDGVEVKFDADDDYTLTVLGPTETGTDITLSIQAAENGGSYSTIKSFSGVLPFSGGPQVRSNAVDLTATTDTTYSLDTDDYLDFRLVLTVSVGGLGTPNHIVTTAGNFLAMLITGIIETRHVLAHGVGSNANMITIDNSLDDSSTAIIDIEGDDGPTYVGPVALSALLDGDADDGDVLTWDDTNSVWAAEAPSGGGGTQQSPRTVHSPVSDLATLSPTNTTQAYDLTDFIGYVTDDTWDNFDTIACSSAHGNSPNYSIAYWLDIAAELNATDDVVTIRPHNGTNETFTLTRTSDTVMTATWVPSAGNSRHGYVTCQFFGRG